MGSTGDRLDGKFNFNEVERMLKAIGALVVAMVLTIYSSLLTGWVLSIIWGWFIVKIFGLPILSIPSAIGVAIVVSCVTHQVSTKEDDREIGEILGKRFLYSTLRPLITLALAWVVHLFV